MSGPRLELREATLESLRALRERRHPFVLHALRVYDALVPNVAKVTMLEQWAVDLEPVKGQPDTVLWTIVLELESMEPAEGQPGVLARVKSRVGFPLEDEALFWFNRSKATTK